jgi:hypothetical protein
MSRELTFFVLKPLNLSHLNARTGGRGDMDIDWRLCKYAKERDEVMSYEFKFKVYRSSGGDYEKARGFKKKSEGDH